MALRISTALRNFIDRDGSLKRALYGGVLKIYSGSQPSSADAAATGTLLASITIGSGTLTNEVRATGSVELTGGASGSVDALTVDGVSIIDNAVPFNTSLAQTASDLADEINSSMSTPDYTASASGAVVTIKAAPGTGAGPNTFAVVTTTTTITKTDTNFSGGVTQVNGLKLGDVSAGVLNKVSGDTWSGVAVASGTAGWFRFYASEADDGSADTTASKLRLDGAISTSGAQINMGSTTVTSGSTQTVSDFPITLPASA